MALPITGQLSLFAIFKEIKGREPNIGERVSFHELVQASNLTNKSFPCPFSRFYGYSHGPRTNKLSLFAGKISGNNGIISVTAQYPAISNLTIDIRVRWDNGAYVWYYGELVLAPSATTASKNVGMSGTGQPTIVDSKITPPGDSVYNYVADY